MNSTHEEIKKYDHPENSYWIYPNHFVDPCDGFTMHIPLWNNLIQSFSGMTDINALELGTARGRATVWLLENLLKSENSYIDTIDWKQVQYHNIIINRGCEYDENLKNDIIAVDVVNNLKPYIEKNKCKFHKCSTEEFFLKSNIPKRIYDFIYIDACHDPDTVLFDGVNSFSFLNKNGIMIFDDYGWGNCSVGVDAFLKAYDEKLTLVYKQWQVIIQKN
jgi:hypothetical protein